MEETKVTKGDAGFNSANEIQEIRGALEHLAMEAGGDKDIVAKLTEAVEQLTKNNAALMAQLSDSMKIKLEMAKKINIKAAKGQDPKGKILTDKETIKSAFERNLYTPGYC